MPSRNAVAPVDIQQDNGDREQNDAQHLPGGDQPIMENAEKELLDQLFDAVTLNNLEVVKNLTKSCEKWLPRFYLHDLKRLNDCYNKVMTGDGAVAKVVQNLTGIKGHQKFIKGSPQNSRTFLPYIGKVIYKLLGNNYRILYQEEEFVQEERLEEYCKLTLADHLLFVAVLTNQKEMAEIFWRFSNSKIGMALVVCKMFKNLSKAAESIREVNLKKTMEENAKSFESLAMEVLGRFYETDRIQAYKHIGAKVEFDLGDYHTPMSIAYDAGAQEFLGHSCCQTLLKLIWMNTMDINTPWYKLLPILTVFTFLWITFKQAVLQYSSMKNNNNIREQQNAENPPGQEYLYQVDSYGKFRWFCLRRCLTAPVNKFGHSFISYMVFLGILTHFLLTELRPLGPNPAQVVSAYEWLIYIWMLAFWAQESKQVWELKISGPLYKLKNKGNMWSKVWSQHERLRFNVRFYRMLAVFSDVWNFMDFLMICLFVATVVVRFTNEKNDFAVVRILFCILILLCYFRVLRFGYVKKELGPRIVIIATLLKDLFFFMLIMMVFIISFGVAFQAFISPNAEPSLYLLGHVLWRPYWQMLGEIFVDEVHEGMGLETEPRNCVADGEPASSQQDVYEYCHEWFLPILLGLFMMITNILLLNLLIAIFSRSFEKAEEESLKIWHYHLYGLYDEYYSQTWMVVPFNFPWYFVKVIIDSAVKCKCCPKPDKEFADNLFCLDECFRNHLMEEKALKEVMAERAEERQ